MKALSDDEAAHQFVTHQSRSYEERISHSGARSFHCRHRLRKSQISRRRLRWFLNTCKIEEPRSSVILSRTLDYFEVRLKRHWRNWLRTASLCLTVLQVFELC